jgi:hypothetical protein
LYFHKIPESKNIFIKKPVQWVPADGSKVRRLSRIQLKEAKIYTPDSPECVVIDRFAMTANTASARLGC